jgi:hypothetical protein
MNQHHTETTLLRSKHAAALTNTLQLAKGAKQIIKQKLTLLQTQYAVTQQLAAKGQQNEETCRAQMENLLLDRRNRQQPAVTTEQELTQLRHTITELRQQISAHSHAL